MNPFITSGVRARRADVADLSNELIWKQRSGTLLSAALPMEMKRSLLLREALWGFIARIVLFVCSFVQWSLGFCLEIISSSRQAGASGEQPLSCKASSSCHHTSFQKQNVQAFSAS